MAVDLPPRERCVRRTRTWVTAGVFTVWMACAFSACDSRWSGPPAPRAVEIVDVTMGSAIRQNQTIASRTDRFQPGQTVFIAVRLFGQGTKGKANVKWYRGDQLVDSDHKTL